MRDVVHERPNVAFGFCGESCCHALIDFRFEDGLENGIWKWVTLKGASLFLKFAVDFVESCSGDGFVDKLEERLLVRVGVSIIFDEPNSQLFVVHRVARETVLDIHRHLDDVPECLSVGDMVPESSRLKLDLFLELADEKSDVLVGQVVESFGDGAAVGQNLWYVSLEKFVVDER